jgi:hypothetical protein
MSEKDTTLKTSPTPDAESQDYVYEDLSKRMITRKGELVVPPDSTITAVVFDGPTFRDVILTALRKNHPPKIDIVE